MSLASEPDRVAIASLARSARSDEQLLLVYRTAGDSAAFEELVHRYERELYSYLRRYLTDAAMAEDAFQATFLQVHLKCGQFEEGRKFRPWLYTVATNQAIDAQRRNRRHRLPSLDRRGNLADGGETGSLADALVSREPDADSNLLHQEQRQWTRGAVRRLPEALRKVVLLVCYQGLKYREAAETLGIPVGTVKSRLHAAVEKLTESQEHSRDET
ncbi:MAG TPA: sigma-70 family RNA polymerase sigma factor [Pirellulales bacterium]|jgi:RNA polymerase sigma-70 factor (ECF subfamily)|nr:sigma-70 family RNA polymerase sigma factor [Pirellulales bacterium]